MVKGIRRADVKDLKEIDSIYVEGTVDEMRLQFPKKSKDEVLRELKKVKNMRIKTWKKEMKSKSQYWIVAEKKERIVGFGQAWIKRENLGIIESVYIYRSFRKKGVGKKIFAGLVKWLKKNHVDNIESRVHIKNKPSIKLHSKLGFRPISLIMRK